MKGFYLYTNIDEYKETSGEFKKTNMQINALRRLGINIERYDVERAIKYNKILIRMPLIPIYSQRILSEFKKNDFKDFDFIYIRKYIIDRSFIKLLKYIKCSNRKIKVIFEIPTYPYDLEFSRWIDMPLLCKERLYRKKLIKYIDKVVTFSEDEEIFGVTTININNGIDINSVKVKNYEVSNFENKTVNLVGVALLAKWHGYDRLIDGMHQYYSNQYSQIVKFHVVGEGSELNRLKRLVDSYGLNEHVYFYGKKHGIELDNIYDKSHIAIGSLGMHRIGFSNGYTLKVREYAARAIPFIKGYNDKIFDDNSFEYMLNVSNNDEPINVNEVLDFYNQKCAKESSNIVEYMTMFAKEKLTWDIQMQKVTDYIKNNE